METAWIDETATNRCVLLQKNITCIIFTGSRDSCQTVISTRLDVKRYCIFETVESRRNETKGAGRFLIRIFQRLNLSFFYSSAGEVSIRGNASCWHVLKLWDEFIPFHFSRINEFNDAWMEMNEKFPILARVRVRVLRMVDRCELRWKKKWYMYIFRIGFFALKWNFCIT